MDLIGATKAANKLMLSPESTPFITEKANWDTQINGIYNMIFPYAHKDYPVRQEVIEYVQDRIKQALEDHNKVNKHNGSMCTPGINLPIIPTQMSKFKMEKPFIYRHISKNGVTMFNINVKVPTSANDQIFNRIGYGI